MERLNKKDLLLLNNKLVKNIPDPHNTNKHCQLFIITKSRKSLNTQT